jgi:DNA-binding NtrC family response regulator
VLERAVMFSSGDEIDPEALSGLMGSSDAPFALGPAEESVHTSSAAIAEAAAHGVVSTTPLPGVFRVEPQVAAEAAPVELADTAEAGTWPTLADVERMHLERTLAAAMQNKSLAAKLLGIDRSSLRRKLQRYGLETEDDD